MPGETEPEFTKRLADELERLILAEGPETIAAFIAEPIMGAGGIIVPPVGYFAAIQTILTKYDVLLIDDEVITGFGRTGNWFGAQTVDMQPTSISMAKQLTAGYASLSAIALNADMTEVIEANTGKIGTLGHGFTYGGHPFACAVGVKALEIYQRRNIVGHVRGMAPIFAAHLQSFADHPLVGEVRVCGLMGTLELVPNKSKTGFKQIGRVGKKFSLEMAARGVIVRNLGDCIGFCPPMIITHAELDEMCAPIGPALNATLDWVRAEKLE